MVWNDTNYQVVTGLFDSHDKISSLMLNLQNQGISQDMVNVLMSDHTRESYAALEKENKIPEGASLGGLSGGTIGAIIGGLTMAGSLLIPGLNLLVAGPIVGVIAGGAVGTAAGSMVGALVGAGIPEYEAKAYEKRLEQEGNVLIAAHIPLEKVSEMRQLFKEAGAQDIAVESDSQAVVSRY